MKYKFFLAFILLLCILVSIPTSAFADGVEDSKLATGTQALISDLTTWLMILAPAVTVLLIIYYLIRKSAGDEMEASAATRCC